MDQLLKDGWNINETQVSQLFDDEILPKTAQEIIKTILNEDLRHFGETAIINKKEESVFEGPCVLQLLRYRNVSVPRIKEELNQTDPAHSIIRLFLTDGHTSVSAILLNSIPGITSETPPGTKILIIGSVPIEANFLILERKNVKILGGRVEEMIEKWNVEKSSVRADGFKSSVGKGTGAPKWVSFGARGQKGQLEKGFKANHVMPKTLKEEDDDFSKNRADIIKELQDSDSTKTFAKPNLAPPPVKAPPPPKERKEKPITVKPNRRGRKNSEDGPDVDVGEYANHKPSGPATLFDFIGGEEKEIVEATSKMSIGGGGGAPKKFEKSGASSGRNGDRGGSGRRNENQGRQDYGKGTSSQNFHKDQRHQPVQNSQNSNFRQNKGAPNQRENQGGPRGNQNFHQNQERGQKFEAQTRPRGNFNEGHGNQRGPQSQGASNPRGNQDSILNQGPPRGNNFNQGPPQNTRGNYNQRSEQTPRGNQGFQQNQGSSNPRGNEGLRGNTHYQQEHQPVPRGNNYNERPPQNPRGNQGFQQQNQGSSNPRGNQGSRGNAQQGQPPHPRGNQNFQQNQGPPRGNQGAQFQVGTQCLATWTDGNLYPATIVELQPNRHAVVRYNQYGNTQIVPVDFLILS
uniref:Survival of motor neuron-related-splicing factor 30 n=1 Tax=Caenorhabditis tropicalis TaxID=1561998 RepID=A0A1I7TYM3_9PELO